MDRASLLQEWKYSTSRSSGAGGQHVNKTETRVTLWWHLSDSGCVNAEQKQLLKTKLAKYINSDGVLQLSDQSSRSQLKNKHLVQQRLLQLIQQSLAPRKPRKAVTPSLAQIEKRLHLKHRQAELKSQRRWRDW